MDLKNKIRPTPTKASFSVTAEMLFPLYPYGKIANLTSQKRKGPTDRQTQLDTLERITDLGPETIGKIEDKLKLTFVSKKEGTGNVCMANSPEVRDDYKDTFNAKDLLYYMYAVLHSPRYLGKYNDLSKIDLVEVPYPNNQYRFWKLVSYGAQLWQLHLLESPTVEKSIDATDEIAKKIAETGL